MSDLKERRVRANIELLQIIAQGLVDYPDLRFGQLLDFLGIVNLDDNKAFYMEPMTMLENVKTKQLTYLE